MYLVGAQSIDQASSTINRILDKGANILYDHYLLEKLPEHSTNDNLQTIKGMMDIETQNAKKAYTIQNDKMPIKINKDSLAVKGTHIVRTAATLRLYPRYSDAPSNKLTAKKRNSAVTSQRLSFPEEVLVKAPEVRSSNSVTITPLPKDELTEDQLDWLRMEEGMRKRKFYYNAIKTIELQKENKAKYLAYMYKNRISRYFHEIESKKQRYTYNFDGSILSCEAVNKKVPLWKKNIWPQIKVNIEGEHPPTYRKNSRTNKRSTSIHEHTTTTSKSYAFSSSAVCSVNLSKMNRMARGNSSKPSFYSDFGSDLAKNDIYNNNNQRQMSHLHLIEVCPNSKIIEVENQAIKDGYRSEILTRKEFLYLAAKTKFKGFFSKRGYNAEEQEDNLIEGIQLPIPLTINEGEFDWQMDKPQSRGGATTKITTSFSGRTKKYTTRDSSIPQTGDRKPMTATHSIRKMDYTRPQTTSHGGRIKPTSYKMLEILFN